MLKLQDFIDFKFVLGFTIFNEDSVKHNVEKCKESGILLKSKVMDFRDQIHKFMGKYAVPSPQIHEYGGKGEGG